MALLIVAALGVPSTSSCGEDANAAIGVPPVEHPEVAPQRDSFLGALSFTSSRDPISVTADSLEFDYRTRVLKYKGGVVATQGDMKVESDVLTVSLDEHQQNRITEVVANGQVRLSKGPRWATGGHAVFNQRQNTVVLSENAVLHDGPNEVSGDRVVVYLDEQRSVVEGGNGRVKAVLHPPKGPVASGAGGENP